ncbi:MAG: aminotransferase class III-fold pyridoxal phosphate-dependent enzyme [Pseudomonadota bacterium]
MNKQAQNPMTWTERAEAVLPAGGFGNFDPSVILTRGEGSRVWDVEGREYIDLLIGSGPMLLGHGHPEVIEAVSAHMNQGWTFFANNTHGIELAEEICSAMACGEHLRYVSTGGEADMYAMRLARAFTGRSKIMKFEGGYHGMSAEALMSLAPTRLVNFPQAIPDTAGTPSGVADEMLIAPFNDAEFARSLLDEYDDEIAAIIVEPLQRIVPPEPGFLQFLREETEKRGIVLIFDEVVTGFRLAYGGAQESYGVKPDLCTLGKVIGGGMPLAAIVGREDIMAHFDKAKVGPEGFTLQMGTLSGNPLASVAGLKTLEILRRPGMYETLRANGRRIMAMIERELGQAGHPFQIVGDPVLFEVVFTPDRVRDYRGTFAGDKHLAGIYNKTLRAHGIFKSDGKTYPHLALTELDFEQIEGAIAAAGRALAETG